MRADVWEEQVGGSGAGHARAVCRRWREAHDGALSELLLHARQPTCACVLRLPYRRFVGLTTLQVRSQAAAAVARAFTVPCLRVAAAMGLCWLVEPCTCDESIHRARFPCMQLVCDGALPPQEMAAALAELAGAPTLRHVHVALCSLDDDSVQALCHLESLQTLRCAQRPSLVYDSRRETLERK